MGTDHGYLAIELARRGRVVYASDVAERPLLTARLNAARRGVAERIAFVLADGVPESLRGRLDCAVIAGMGGETIAGILARAPWLRDDGVTLVLQPQTKLGALTDFLFAHGFAPPLMTTVAERHRSYTILTIAR